MKRFVLAVNFAFAVSTTWAQDLPHTYEPIGERFARMSETAKFGAYLTDFDFCSEILRSFVARKNPSQMIEKLSRSKNPEKALEFTIGVKLIMNDTHKKCMASRGYIAHPKP